MPAPDQNTAKKEQKSEPNLIRSVTIAAIATGFAHPARVLLNRASMYNAPLETVTKSIPHLFNGLFINVLRGSLSTGLQSHTKHVVHDKVGFKTSIVAAAFCGTLVASTLETALIRKTMMDGATTANRSLWRFSPPLSTLYFLREFGFSVSVLAKNDLPPAGQYGVLFGAAWMTAVAHKFAALEAIRDRLPADVTVPDFRKGVGSAIQGMANGNVYTHPVFQVPFKNPATTLAKVGNLMHVSCGVNMYVFRLLYLGVFSEAYHLASKTGPINTQSFFGFFNSKQTGQPKLENNKDSEKKESSFEEWSAIRNDF